MDHSHTTYTDLHVTATAFERHPSYSAARRAETSLYLDELNRMMERTNDKTSKNGQVRRDIVFLIVPLHAQEKRPLEVRR